MVSGARSSDGSIIPVFFVFFPGCFGVLSCWCVMASESPYLDRLCLVYRNWSSVAVPTFGTTSYNLHYVRPSVSWFRHDPPTNATRVNLIQRVIHYTHARRISFEYKPPPLVSTSSLPFYPLLSFHRSYVATPSSPVHPPLLVTESANSPLMSLSYYPLVSHVSICF